MKNFDLLRYLKKWWFLIMIVVAVGCLLVYRFVAANQAYTATAVIQYTNSQAADGLNVDGSKIDTSEITSATVINRTIENLGLSSNTESIRSKITVKEVISDDEQARKDAAIDNGDEYEYFPTIYQVSFTVYDKNAEDYARRVLDSILSNYFRYYGEQHVDASIFPNNAINVSVDNYEYIDCVEMLRTTANESASYLNEKSDEKSSFYSVKTGYSFSDLARRYTYIKNNSLSDLYAYIIEHQLVKDCDVFIDKKQNDALQYQIQINSLMKNIDEAKDIIDQFGDKTLEGEAVRTNANTNSDASDTQIITDVERGWESQSIDANRDVTTTYDKLINQYARLQTNLIDAKIGKGQTEEILEAYSGVTTDTDPNSEEAKWARARIDELSAQFTELYNIALDTINEYNQVKGADNITMKCSIAVNEKINLKLYQALAVVLFLFVGCFVAIFLGRLGDFIDYYLYVDKKTGLPNRERCDDMIEHYGVRKLPDRFAFVTVQLDLSGMGRNEGDEALRAIGESMQRVFRSLGFVGYNGAGQFMVMMENATVEFTKTCIEHLDVALMNSDIGKIGYAVYVGSSNSTADDLYEIRSLLRLAMKRAAEAKMQGKHHNEYVVTVTNTAASEGAKA